MRRSAFLAAFAKTALGVGVFVSTVAGWSLVAPHVSAHRPLPDADGPDGSCAIWFVGSSSIHRWTSMRADMAPWGVRNRGVNGALTGEVSARFQNEAVTTPPGAIVFYLGENDIAAGADADDVEGAVEHLVRIAAQRMPGTRLFVIGLKPSPARWSQRAAQRRFNARARAWASSTADSYGRPSEPPPRRRSTCVPSPTAWARGCSPWTPTAGSR